MDKLKTQVVTFTSPHRIIETKPKVFASGTKVWIKNCVKLKIKNVFGFQIICKIKQVLK